MGKIHQTRSKLKHCWRFSGLIACCYIHVVQKIEWLEGWLADWKWSLKTKSETCICRTIIHHNMVNIKARSISKPHHLNIYHTFKNKTKQNKSYFLWHFFLFLFISNFLNKELFHPNNYLTEIRTLLFDFKMNLGQ